MRRGGGSRGSRRSGGSRISSSSRRNHGRSYRGGYYGGGYYGRRGGMFGYYNPIRMIIGLFVFGLIIIVIIAAIIGGGQNISNDLEPGEHLLVDSSSFPKATMTVTSGQIETYFFDFRPNVAGSILTTSSETFTVLGENFEYFADFYNTGSIVDLNWTVSNDAWFFVIIGNSNFDKWKDEGENTQVHEAFGLKGNYQKQLQSNENIYFVIENVGGNSIDVFFEFAITTPTYDLGPSKDQINGNYDIDLDAKYIVVANVGSGLASFQLELNKTFGFGIVFLVLFIIYIAFLVWLGRKLNSRYNKGRKQTTGFRSTARPAYQSPQPYASQSPARQVPQQTYQAPAPVQTAGMDASPAKPVSTQFVQRPKPKYCRSCGAAVLPTSVFCSECGAAL